MYQGKSELPIQLTEKQKKIFAQVKKETDEYLAAGGKGALLASEATDLALAEEISDGTAPETDDDKQFESFLLRAKKDPIIEEKAKQDKLKIVRLVYFDYNYGFVIKIFNLSSAPSSTPSVAVSL